MRRYWVAAAIGLALAAGGAAAQESAVVSLGDRAGDRVGHDSAFDGGDMALAAIIAGGVAILIDVGLSSGGSHGAPASP